MPEIWMLSEMLLWKATSEAPGDTLFPSKHASILIECLIHAGGGFCCPDIFLHGRRIVFVFVAMLYNIFVVVEQV